MIMIILRAAYVKSHPGNWLIFRYWRTFDELKGKFIIVECECEDGPWRCPGADHEVVNRHLGVVVLTFLVGCEMG